MKNEKLTAALHDFGLTETEARVYVAALSLGPSTAQKIARAATIKRTTTYTVIDSLQQQGLMNIELRGFKRRFAAADPEHLATLFEKRRTTFKTILPELSALYNLKGGESLVKYYEGLPAVKTIYEDLLRTVRPHEDYLVISNLTQWLSLDKEHFTDFGLRRAKLPINIRMLLLPSEDAARYKKLERNFNFHIRLLPKQTKLTTNLVVIPQRVVVQQLTQPIIAVVIENKSAIQMHREMFEIIWRSIPE